MSDYTGKKFDTYAETTYLVRLAVDAKTWTREKDGGEDVVLTFVDNSRLDNNESLWVDARVANFQAERAKGYLKGDIVQVKGKLRFVKSKKDGEMRGKMYDATVQSFVSLKERGAEAPETTPPAFA